MNFYQEEIHDNSVIFKLFSLQHGERLNLHLELLEQDNQNHSKKWCSGKYSCNALRFSYRCFLSCHHETSQNNQATRLPSFSSEMTYLKWRKSFKSISLSSQFSWAEYNNEFSSFSAVFLIFRNALGFNL